MTGALCDGLCLGCAGCDSAGLGNPLYIYRDYIDGKRELYEINAGIRGGIIR